jgi:predicted ATP-dependent serine protease
MSATDDALFVDEAFSCPRCGVVVTERFYGPCTDCRRYLRGALGTDARQVAETVYEPKMNVVPNQVATKE